MQEKTLIKATALFLCMLMLLLGTSPAALASASDGNLAPDGAAEALPDGTLATENPAQAVSDGNLAAENPAQAASDGNLAPEDGTQAVSDGNLAPENAAEATSDGNLSPDGAAAQEEEEAEELQIRMLDSDGHVSGYIEPYSGHKTQSLPRSGRRVLLGFPSKFDLRTSLNGSRVTGVRDQGSYGTCWAFSAAGVVESNLLMQNIGSYDLSELQLAYFSYMRSEDVAAAGGTPGDTVEFYHPNTNVLMRGGNAEETMASLANRMGFTTESRVPYSQGANAINNGLAADYAQEANVVGLRNAVRFNGQTDRDAIKAFLQLYGAATIEYFHNDLFFYNPNTAAYCCPGEPTGWGEAFGGGHQVTLVGWDDNYAVSNFGEQKPEGPGAWICKNSWSSRWGMSGYFYISYYDVTVGDIYFFEADKSDAYDRYYQHDGGLLTSHVSVGAAEASEAAVFTAQEASYLCAAGFFANAPEMEVTVEVYRQLPSDGFPDAGKLQDAATVTHKLSYEGYYTLPLARPVALAEGERFSVVITAKDTRNYFVKFSADAPGEYAGVYNNVQANEGECFVKAAGGAWSDLGAESESGSFTPVSLRIKAMAVRATRPLFQNFQVGDLNDDGRVGIGDAAILSAHVAKVRHINGAAQMCADMNADGQTNVQDLLLLVQYLAGRAPSFPA